jgi:cytochrome b561
MTSVLQTLKIAQWAFLASVILYIVVGEIAGPSPHRVDTTLSYAFATIGVSIVGMIFVVRRTLVLRASESLATRPDDLLSLNQFRIGYFATYALCEVLALFGIILRFTGCNLLQSLPYYLSGLVLLAFFRPKTPAVRT